MMLPIILYVVAPATVVLGVWVLLRTAHFVREMFPRTTSPGAPEEKKE